MAASVNQVCLLAAFKQLVTLPPQRTQENANVAISMLRMVHPLGLRWQYRDVWRTVVDHLDTGAQEFRTTPAADFWPPTP